MGQITNFFLVLSMFKEEKEEEDRIDEEEYPELYPKQKKEKYLEV